MSNQESLSSQVAGHELAQTKCVNSLLGNFVMVSNVQYAVSTT